MFKVEVEKVILVMQNNFQSVGGRPIGRELWKRGGVSYIVPLIKCE